MERDNFTSDLSYCLIVIGKHWGLLMSLVNNLLYQLYITDSFKARSSKERKERGLEGEVIQVEKSHNLWYPQVSMVPYIQE